MRSMVKAIFCVYMMFSSCPLLADSPVGHVSFVGEATPGFLEVEGSKIPIMGKVTQYKDSYSGEFWVELSKFKTGMDLRDEHMRDYLEVDKFPKAKLKLKPFRLSSDEIELKGDLTLHGVTRPIKAKARVHADKKLLVDGKIDITEYGIDVPVYKLLTVAKEVSIHAEIDL